MDDLADNADSDGVTLSVFGLSETDVRERLRPITAESRAGLNLRLDFPVIYVTLLPCAPPVGECGDDTALLREAAALLGHAVFARGVRSLAEVVVERLLEMRWRLTTAESCTGGLLASLVTRVPGASAVFDLGLVTYSDTQKRALLGVDAADLATHGAVSRDVARAMAVGARHVAGADIAVSVTGIAGPSGGRPDKPVGTVYFGLASERAVTDARFRFEGPRHEIQARAAATALDLVRRHLATEET